MFRTNSDCLGFFPSAAEGLTEWREWLLSVGISDFLLCELEYNVSVTLSSTAAKQAKIRCEHALMADGDYKLTVANLLILWYEGVK